MKTGIISDAYYTFDNYQQGMPIMKAHGYDSIDYQGFGSIKNSPLYKMSDGELERYLTDMRECAKANGLGIHQLHGAWPHVDDFTAEGRAKTVEYFKMNILGAKMLGCPRVVIHPLMPKLGLDDPYDEEEDFEVNGLVLETLAPVARENGVTVCFENMPFLRQTCFSRVKNIKKLLTMVNDEHIKACLDVGHFNSEKGDICEAICLLGEHLSALHVHDDRYGQDRHLIPFQGETDWNGFVRGLKEISFDGVISLETRIQPGTPPPIREAMELQLSKIARYFANELEK